jgi:hypothetical protein
MQAYIVWEGCLPCAGGAAQGQVAQWLNTTFPPSQGQHTFHNGGRSSTGSPFFARRASPRGRGLLGKRVGRPTPRAQKLRGSGRVHESPGRLQGRIARERGIRGPGRQA